MYTCIHVCMHACMHVYDSICAFVDIYVHMYKRSTGAQSSKVIGRIFADAGGQHGGIISWDTGQCWVRVTTQIKESSASAKSMQKLAAQLNPRSITSSSVASAVLNIAQVPQVVTVPAVPDGKTGGQVEDEDDGVESVSSEDSEEEIEWKNWAHAAATHNRAVIQHLYRDHVFTWHILDIRYSPQSSRDRFSNFCKRWFTYVAHYIYI
jgi:hypothetical protein